MPPQQRDWVCPLCYGSLPELPSQALKRAKRAHVAEKRPGVTLTQLHNLRSTGRPKKTNGVSKLQRKRHDERRQKVFSGHSLVQVTPPERVARGVRGSLRYCKKCFLLLGKACDHTLKSCSERLKDLNTKPHVQRVKRVWWARLKENEPGHAQALAAAVGKSFTQLDEIFCLKASHTERSIEIARNFALNHGNVRLLRRKWGKQPLSRDEVAKASAGRRALPKNLLMRPRVLYPLLRPKLLRNVLADTALSALERRSTQAPAKLALMVP